MELYIGGVGQGKLEYVLETHKGLRCKIVDGEETDKFQSCFPDETVVFFNLHLWIRKMLKEGKNAEEQAKQLFDQHPDCIIVSDEIGNGLVPTDAFERQYRDVTGRILIEAAERSERVERIICGLAQRLK